MRLSFLLLMTQELSCAFIKYKPSILMAIALSTTLSLPGTSPTNILAPNRKYANQTQISRTPPLSLSKQEALRIGRKIWQNEAGSSTEKLTWWSAHEKFASLGIGHFIWYPAHEPITFTQTFPHLLLFLQRHGATLPAWLDKNPLQPCPWNTHADFLRELTSARMIELRTFLVNTIELQVFFIVQRLEQVLPALLATATPSQQKQIKAQFYRVAKSKNGLYALIDYINFKGEGTNPKETYTGQGWGLKQVLLGMHGTEPGTAALKEFTQAAQHLLTQRVAHAPAERHEQKWLPGWKKRCDTYQT